MRSYIELPKLAAWFTSRYVSPECPPRTLKSHQSKVVDGVLYLGIENTFPRPHPPKFSASLAHEMAHLIEIPATRCLRWDLRIRSSVEVLGRMYFEPRTWQATQRECRVVAIEAAIVEWAGGSPLKTISRKAIALARWQPDYSLIPRLPSSSGRSQSPEQERAAFLRQEIKSLRNQYPIDLVMTLWRERVSLVERLVSHQERYEKTSLQPY